MNKLKGYVYSNTYEHINVVNKSNIFLSNKLNEMKKVIWQIYKYNITVSKKKESPPHTF